ncbi:MAG: FecR domain-containing protein [Desulfovibrio sp.]|nr:FecR domain-containing protein [Desulfovibrio sp.]
MKARILTFAFLSILSLTGTVVAAVEPVGVIVSCTPGAFVERDGARIPLQLKDSLHSGDILSTDTTGRLRAWMRDDTTLSLGTNTEFAIEDYDDRPAKAVFTSKMTGFARILTGKIVKANPEGFNVITPVSRIGIRGTILSIDASKDTTTVFVESTMQQVLVNGITVPSGSKALVNGVQAIPQIMPMTATDRQHIEDSGQPPLQHGTPGQTSGRTSEGTGASGRGSKEGAGVPQPHGPGATAGQQGPPSPTAQGTPNIPAASGGFHGAGNADMFAGGPVPAQSPIGTSPMQPGGTGSFGLMPQMGPDFGGMGSSGNAFGPMPFGGPGGIGAMLPGGSGMPRGFGPMPMGIPPADMLPPDKDRLESQNPLIESGVPH